MKKICWITVDCFVDCDIEVVNRLSKRGFDIFWYVVLSKNSRFSEDEVFKSVDNIHNLNIEIVLNPYRKRDPAYVFLYLKLLQKIKQSKSDYIYVNVGVDTPWILPFYLCLPSNKTIVTAHQGQVHIGMKNKRILSFIRKIAYGNVKYVNCFSSSQETLFSKNYPRAKTFVIPLALKYFGECSNQRSSEGKIRFLSFGIINYTKNIDLLIDAACLLFERGVRNFVVSINGMCKDWSFYQDRIKYPEIFELSIRMIRNDEIPNLFNSSHYLVQPYRVTSQSGPTKIAFQYNVPILASNLPGFIEEIKEGVNGYFFETGNVENLANKMQFLIENHSEYDSILKREREYTLKHYSNESIVDKYVKMFNSVQHE